MHFVCLYELLVLSVRNSACVRCSKLDVRRVETRYRFADAQFCTLVDLAAVNKAMHRPAHGLVKSSLYRGVNLMLDLPRGRYTTDRRSFRVTWVYSARLVVH
jgi:hypothetical protein